MKKIIIASFFVLSLFVFAQFLKAPSVSAEHSWGSYHWARTANPLVLKLGDNLTASWDPYLSVASTDWSLSAVLNTVIVSGSTSPKTCKGVTGRIEVCNSKYGNNGWLGIAQIWISGSHITKGITKLNDTYFNTASYNTPAWKQFVLCQEVGHAFGLNHQDENFSNANLGSCMDYTNNPSTNQHPNPHDYEELADIYAHLDATNTASVSLPNGNSQVDMNDPSAWGKIVRESADKKIAVFERNLGNDEKMLTHVIWAK